MIVNAHVAVSSANIQRSPGEECAVAKNQPLKWHRRISNCLSTSLFLCPLSVSSAVLLAFPRYRIVIYLLGFLDLLIP